MHAPAPFPTRRAGGLACLAAALAVAAALALAGCASTPVAPAATAAPAAARATAPKSAPKSALWVGNSFFYYNDGMHGHVGQLLAQSRPGEQGYRSASATIRGTGLNWHDVEALFKPAGVGPYPFDAPTAVLSDNGDKPFDVVIMMDCSRCPLQPRLAPVFRDCAARHSATVRRHGAEPVFFMSWAYADRPGMTEPLAAAYVRAGADNHARVVPAGLAFARSIAARPDLNLYVADKRHPSLMGTYLAACTVLGSVYGISPVGNAYTAGLPADAAAQLQSVAWQTVQGFRQP